MTKKSARLAEPLFWTVVPVSVVMSVSEDITEEAIMKQAVLADVANELLIAHAWTSLPSIVTLFRERPHFGHSVVALFWCLRQVSSSSVNTSFHCTCLDVLGKYCSIIQGTIQDS